MAGYLIHSFGDVGSLSCFLSLMGISFFKNSFDPSRKERSLYCIDMKLQVREKSNYKERGAGS